MYLTLSKCLNGPTSNHKSVSASKSEVVGGFNPFENMLVKLDHFPANRFDHKKYLSCHHPDKRSLLKILSMGQVALVESAFPTDFFQLIDFQETKCG